MFKVRRIWWVDSTSAAHGRQIVHWNHLAGIPQTNDDLGVTGNISAPHPGPTSRASPVNVVMMTGEA